MERWLQPALDYISTWIEFQMRASQQPGCVFAVAHRDQVVLERAIGYADIVSKEKSATDFVSLRTPKASPRLGL